MQQPLAQSPVSPWKECLEAEKRHCHSFCYVFICIDASLSTALHSPGVKSTGECDGGRQEGPAHLYTRLRWREAAALLVCWSHLSKGARYGAQPSPMLTQLVGLGDVGEEEEEEGIL